MSDDVISTAGLSDMAWPNGHSDYISVMDSLLNTGTTTIQPLYTSTSSIPWISTNQNNKPLVVQGDAEITGDLMIKGKNISDSLERIEEKLAILHPNHELEEKWENLRDLRKQYIELEKEILEKEQIWNVLKK